MKIAVFSIFRNSSACLPDFLGSLERTEELGHDLSYFFFENDSTDDTRELLSEFLRGRDGKIGSEKWNAPSFGSVTDPQRMALLCCCRNACKDLSRGREDFDYALLIDSDIRFSDLSLTQALNTISSVGEDAVMVTANVRQNIPDLIKGYSQTSYYDTYPLRDKFGNQGLYFSDCPFVLQEDALAWHTSKPVQTMSSFGGYALVRWSAFKDVRWSTNGACDHVNFCHSLAEYGKIYADPKLVVETTVDLSKLNMPLLTEQAKKQAEQIPQINAIFNKSRSSTWL